MKTLKSVLAEAIVKDDDIDIHNLPFINKWPNDEDGEALDLENYSIVSLTDDKLVMCCGGDWQDPMKLTIELIGGVLEVTSVEVGVFDDGLDFDDILHILTK